MIRASVYGHERTFRLIPSRCRLLVLLRCSARWYDRQFSALIMVIDEQLVHLHFWLNYLQLVDLCHNHFVTCSLNMKA